MIGVGGKHFFKRKNVKIIDFVIMMYVGWPRLVVTLFLWSLNSIIFRGFCSGGDKFHV